MLPHHPSVKDLRNWCRNWHALASAGRCLMGAKNVSSVFSLWSHLPDRPFRLLTWLALKIPDENNPPYWWGGPTISAVGLGLLIPDEVPGDREIELERQAGFRALRRVIKGLTEPGALTVVRHSGPGQAPMYRLNLSMDQGTLHVRRPRRVLKMNSGRRKSGDAPAETAPTEAPDDGTPDVSRTNTGRSDDEQRTFDGQAPDVARPPQEEEDPKRTTSKNEIPDLRTAVTVTRAREAAEEPDFSPVVEAESPMGIGCDYPACRGGIWRIGRFIEKPCPRCRPAVASDTTE